MENIDYKKLYELEDKILNILFENNSEFYLTGGTCLSRFYYNKRFSMDLDFFTNFSNSFHFSIREFLDKLISRNFIVEKKIESKDFVRVVINDFLQLDFVNDRVKYIGEVIVNGKIKIDNITNILTNKISAVMSRDSVKDIFDIYIIAKNEEFNWNKIIKQAQEKMSFGKEDLIERLTSFPKVLINDNHFIDTNILDKFDKDFDVLINDILLGIDNSLRNN